MYYKIRLVFLGTFIILSIIFSHTVSFAGSGEDTYTFENAEYYYKLGNFNANLKNYREAEKTYMQAIKIKPDYTEAYVSLGIIYNKMGRYRDALEIFERAIKINPEYSEAYYYLGLSYEKPNMYGRAIAAFKNAIKNKPDYAEAHYDLGVAYLILNDIGSALEEYDILKKLNAETAHTLFHHIFK